MQFTAETLKQVLRTIEERLEFSSKDLKCPQSYDIIYNIDTEELINSIGTNKSDEIKYCLAVLREIGYINISHGVIRNITPNGYKLMSNVLHGIDFKY